MGEVAAAYDASPAQTARHEVLPAGSLTATVAVPSLPVVAVATVDQDDPSRCRASVRPATPAWAPSRSPTRNGAESPALPVGASRLAVAAAGAAAVAGAAPRPRAATRVATRRSRARVGRGWCTGASERGGGAEWWGACDV